MLTLHSVIANQGAIYCKQIKNLDKKLIIRIEPSMRSRHTCGNVNGLKIMAIR